MNILIFHKLLITNILIFILALSPINNLLESGSDWIELQSTNEGEQWIKKDSLQRLSPTKLSIVSRYRPNQSLNEKNKEIEYTMEIDCLNNLYRDKSVNNIKQLSNDWQSPLGDKLINATILKACSI